MMRDLSDAEWGDLTTRQPGPMLYGVVSTGIFCRAGCPARTPLRKNVRWLDSIQDGKEAGMRACKRCQPEKEQVLDCVGMLCPLPVLKTRKVLSGMASGQVLLVLTSDRMALIDLPHFCAQSGHDYLDAVETGTDGGKQAHHRIRVA